MDNITMQTRREAYDAIQKMRASRAQMILDYLGNKEMTVSEITAMLTSAGAIPYYNRNFVAPRLTELKEQGLVETCGRREALYTGTTEAVWRKTTLSLFNE